MISQLSVLQVKGLQDLPSQDSDITPGQYVIRSVGEQEVESDSDKVQAKVWFQSPPLNNDTIRKINSLQLFAETHDQGFVNEPLAGNWTWLELAIFENRLATLPREKEGVKLIWTSHLNRLGEAEYGWDKGAVFGAHDDLLRLLEEGNVISIRICARFPAWRIAARAGYLVIDIGPEVDRESLNYGNIVSEISNIQNIITEANVQTQAPFQPAIPKSLFRADTIITGGERPLRVLSLDGGGVRGLSALYLLDAVMKQSNLKKKPCEVFDMIGGTSTGGLIAIMLGRLKMTVEECIANYREFMTKVFGSGWLSKMNNWRKTGQFYDASILENVIKELLRKFGKDDMLLYDKDSVCKVFVMAVRQDAPNNRGPVFLRSYNNPHELSSLPNIKLWEAARATSAAPTYFEPLKVDNYVLIDGGLGANNPLGWLWTEVLGVFGPARITNCFLSIGTGIPPNKALVNPRLLSSDVNVDSVKSFSSVATNTEIVNILFRVLIDAYAPKATAKKYWRLNVGEADGDNYKDPGELDDVAGVEKLLKMTQEYIKAQKDVIKEVANALSANL